MFVSLAKNNMDKKIELTEEQKKELENIFQYKEKAEYTDEEIATLKEMFDTPSKLLILRKALGLFTAEERGLSFVSPQNLIQADASDMQKYAIETAINNLATEKVRNALFSLYMMLKASKKEDKRKEFEKSNLEDFEEKKNKEKFEEEVEKGQKQFGENL